MAAGAFELAIDTAELVVHSIHVRCERAELVAVCHVDASGEIAGSDRREPPADSLDWPDEGPREDEAQEQGEEDGSCADSDEEVAGADIRAAVFGDQRVRLDGRRLGQPPSGDFEVDGQVFGARVQRERMRARAGDLSDEPFQICVILLDVPEGDDFVGRRLELELGRCAEQREHRVNRLAYRSQARRRRSLRRFAPVQPLRVVGRARAKCEHLA